MQKIIEISELGKVYPNGTEALKNIDLSIEQGERIGFIGPNGAGKTTLVKHILGILKPTSGSIRLWGNDAYTLSKERKKKIGFLMEDRGLYEKLTVEENALFWTKLLGIDTKEVKIVLGEWGLWEKRKTLVKELSAGMKQKLAIVRSIIHNPPLLVLDEPTSNLDPLARRNIVDLLNNFDKTLFMTSHDLFDVERICTRIILIRHGDIVADGSIEHLKKKLGVSKKVEIRVSGDYRDIKKALSNRFGVEVVKGVITLEDKNPKDLVKFLVENGVDVERVEEKKVNLEDMYTMMVREDEE